MGEKLPSNKCHSLVVLPRDYLIVAKSVTAGGELSLLKKLSELSTLYCDDCDTRIKSGNVNVLGPLADLIKITGVKSAHENVKRHKPGDPTAGEKALVYKSTRRKSAQVFEHLQLDVRSLKTPQEKLKLEPLKTTVQEFVTKEDVKQTEKSVTEQEPHVKEEGKQTAELEKQLAQAENVLPEVPLDADEEKVDKKGPTSGVKKSGDEGQALKSRMVQQMLSFNNVVPLPLHCIPKLSVLVKWKQHPNIPCYTARSVFDTLSTFGVIVAMGQLSINSCLVVFENFVSSITLVRESFVGPKVYPLICSWYYPHMYYHSIDLLDIHPYKKHKVVSEEAKWLYRFREMQNQVLSCFKTTGSAISYNRATFRP